MKVLVCLGPRNEAVGAVSQRRDEIVMLTRNFLIRSPALDATN